MRTIRGTRPFTAFALSLLPLAAAGCAPGEATVELTQSALVTGDSGFAVAGGVGSYDVPLADSWNSHRGINHSTALATAGTYRVDFPLLGDFTTGGGTVQVGGINEGPTAHGGFVRHCKVVNWGGFSSGSTLQVFVNCYNATGLLVPGDFYVSFQRRSGNIGAQSAYAWADQPSTASYTPASNYQWSSGGGSVTITREGVGRYLVNFPGQVPATRILQVTAYGGGSVLCSPAAGSADTNARVRCYDTNSALVDSRFTVSYSTRSVDNTPTYSFATVQLGTPGAVLSSYGSIAAQCGLPDQPIQTPVTVKGSATVIRVHFPQMSVLSSTEVIVMPYDAGARVICNSVGKGNETGGAFTDIVCYTDSTTFAPAGTKIVVTFSSIAAIFC